MMGKEAWVAGADRGEAPGPKPVRLGRRLRLRRQPPGSWQLCNGGVQRGVSRGENKPALPSWDTRTRQEDRHAQEDAELPLVCHGCEAGKRLDAKLTGRGNLFFANVYLRGGFEAIAEVGENSPAGRQLGNGSLKF